MSPDKARDVVDIGIDIEKTRDCYNCSSSMVIRNVKCTVSEDMFGSGVHGEWTCKKHPWKPYYAVQLRRSYSDYEHGISEDIPVFMPYRKTVEMGFPWKCPICEEPMNYVDKRDFAAVG
jgi:hypothetical protein